MIALRFKNKILDHIDVHIKIYAFILLKLYYNSVFIKFSVIVFVIISRLCKWGSRFFCGNIIIILPGVLAFAFILQILSHSFYVTRTVNPKCTIECYTINYCTEYSVIRALPLEYHCSRLELKWVLFFTFFTLGFLPYITVCKLFRLTAFA